MDNDYADQITIRVSAYGDYPFPDNLSESWGTRIHVGAAVDREALVAEITRALQKRQLSYTLDDTRRVTSWGAAGASIEIVAAVSATVGGLAGLVAAIEQIAARRRRATHEPELSGMDSASATRSARYWLAAVLETDPEALSVETIEPTQEGFRVTLAARQGHFVVEVAERREVYRLKRLR